MIIGQEDYDRLRPLSYSNADVFLVCFAVGNKASFENVAEKWAPELRRYCPGVPILLVGTQMDRREELPNERVVSAEQAQKTARDLRAGRYVECSAKTREGLNEVFAEAILLALDPKRSAQSKKGKCQII